MSDYIPTPPDPSRDPRTNRNYDAYYEAAMTLVRAGGIIGLDNTLWRGRVVDTKDQRAKTVAFRALNAKLHADQRVELVVLPLGDGLTLALKL